MFKKFLYVWLFYVMFISLPLSMAAVGAHPCVRPLRNINAGSSEFQRVAYVLSQAKTISGHFTQTKVMPILSKPLFATGHFVLSKKDGLKWYQTKPFHSTLLVTNNKIFQQIAGTPATVITKASQPVVFSFTNIFLSIFNGDTKKIQEYFRVKFVGSSNQWTIILTPLGSPLNKAIVRIEMSGGKYISSITVYEIKKNKMTLHFSKVHER